MTEVNGASMSQVSSSLWLPGGLESMVPYDTPVEIFDCHDHSVLAINTTADASDIEGGLGKVFCEAKYPIPTYEYPPSPYYSLNTLAPSCDPSHSPTFQTAIRVLRLDAIG